MQNSLLQIITEEETDLLDLDIYEKFPYLREEKQKFNEQAQNICYEYANNLFEIDKFFSSDNHQLSLEANLFSQIKQANSSNENKLTKSFEFKEFCKNLTSSNINFDSISQNANDKSTNLQSQTFKDLLNQYANGISEDKNAQYSIQNPQILNQQDSPENELIKQSQRFPKTSLNFIEEGFFNQLQEVVYYKFKELLISNQNSQFYGLDDRIIDLKEIKLEGDGRITYKNKQDLKTVTFLISGYLTQDFSASENFQLLVSTKNKECQDNLFIFFKWSDSRLYKILDKFLNNCINNYQPQIYQDYLKELIDSSLQEHFNQIVIKSIYWLIELLGKCLKLAGTSLFQNQIQQFKTALDSIIEDFQASYEQAKIGGAILAESINNQNLMGSLNIDFMGHSLGTVVTAYALKNLSISARYLMLFGGAATIEEIEGSQQMFQKCYNFYSDNDSVIKTFLIKAKLIGNQAFIGTKAFGQINQKYFNLNTKIDHIDYMNKYQELYDLAIKQFNSPSNSIDQLKKPNIMKIGFGGLLLYLLQKTSKNSRVSIIYLFILYIYYLFQ